MKKLFATHKKRIWTAAVLAASLLLTLVLGLVYHRLAGLLQSQRAAERFRGRHELPFSQVTAVFPVGDGTDRQGVYEFQKVLDAKLFDLSLEPPENGSLYQLGYSARGKLSVTGTRDTAEVNVLGVGGDYFAFHPLHLRSGSYISGDDLMKDTVVLDLDLAWRLFGSLDVAGLPITVGGVPCLVAGVVQREDDFASRRCYTDGPGLFLAYDLLNALAETKIGVLEAVCVEPLDSFTRDTLAGSFASADLIQNSGRFGVEAIFGILKDFGARSLRTSPVVYPYWENAARLIEDHLCLLLALTILFALAPAVAAVVGLVKLIQLGWRQLKRLARWLVERLNGLLYRLYQRKRARKKGGGARGGSAVPEREEGLRR